MMQGAGQGHSANDGAPRGVQGLATKEPAMAGTEALNGSNLAAAGAAEHSRREASMYVLLRTKMSRLGNASMREGRL